MTEMIAGAGRITGLGSGISSKIILGLPPAHAKKAGQKPMNFVASAGQMADLGEDDLITVRFSRSDHSIRGGAVAGCLAFPGAGVLNGRGSGP
jgi:hypothetical protein